MTESRMRPSRASRSRIGVFAIPELVQLTAVPWIDEDNPRVPCSSPPDCWAAIGTPPAPTPKATTTATIRRTLPCMVILKSHIGGCPPELNRADLCDYESMRADQTTLYDIEFVQRQFPR